jgi:phage terminase Nu1 subunit (DNA packaging protein)
MGRPPKPIDSHGAPGLISEYELYTREELCRRLGLGVSALRSMRRQGLPIVRKGSRMYFVGRHVIAWFAAESRSEQAV